MKTEMSEAAKKAKANYQKKWSRNHPENVKKHQVSYWGKKAAELETEDKK